MRISSVRLMIRWAMVVTAVVLVLPVAGVQAAADDLDSLAPDHLIWLARKANREGQYKEAARHARAAIRRNGVGPEVLCPAWMNVFYAAHRTGDRDAAAAATPILRRVGGRAPRR